MADISKVSIDGGRTEYDISDDAARERVTTIEGKIPSAASSSNKLVDQSSVNTALSGKVDTSSVGANNGIATLDSSGKVPSSQLPSYVDDVIEGYLYEGSFYEDAQHTELITPESSKIYTDLSTNKIYRWGGSAYVDVTGASAWGEIVGTLSNQTDLQIELNRAYTKTASETSSIDDLDLIPVQKISASSDGRRNIKFRNLKSVLKTYFDDEYISASVEDETLILG